ncbi:MAG: PEP-CTERM sorting domain-containing protein [Armatimonadota bacterium]
MMKRLIVLSVVMLAVMATAASAAFDTAWTIKLRVTDLNNCNGGAVNIYGTAATTAQNSSVPVGDQVYAYITGSEPNYYFRRIVLPGSPSDVLVWNITVATRQTYKMNWFRLHLWNETGAANDLDDNWESDPANAFKVNLYQGNTLVYTYDPKSNGTSLAPQFQTVFPIQPGTVLENFFTLKREPIPEPGSILALASGLVGLAGFVARRRR